MKDLNILFINDVPYMKSYRIHKLIKRDNGYYKLDHDYFINEENYEEFKNNTYQEYCYVINYENRILKKIYSDKIIVLRGIVDNLYNIEENQNKTKVKKINKIRTNYFKN